MFRAIIGHQGPLLASDPDWKGSKYNVQVEWETGEITFEPLSIIGADDPVTCAAYAKENDRLALEGWHRLRNLAKKDKVLARTIKQSKIKQVGRSQTYMFGYLIPRNYMEAMQFDSENKNSEWYDAIKKEMESMREYKVFKNWDEAILDKQKKVMNSPRGIYCLLSSFMADIKLDWWQIVTDTIYIKTQVLRLLRYYSPAPRNIARRDWVTQNITHNMTSSIVQSYGPHSL